MITVTALVDMCDYFLFQPTWDIPKTILLIACSKTFVSFWYRITQVVLENGHRVVVIFVVIYYAK